MQIENVGLFHSECVAAGLQISGVDSNSNIHFIEPDVNDIGPLVAAAHGTALSSDECLALKAIIGDELWATYVEARKAPIKAKRGELYKSNTDPLFMAAMEESTTLFDAVEQVYNVKVDKTKWDAWLLAKTEIRESLPYPS